MRRERLAYGLALGALVTLAGRHARAEELTATSSGERAVTTSFERAAAVDASSAAGARVDQARSALLPRIGVSGRYTRLSEITPPVLFPFAIAATNAPAGTPSPPTTSSGLVSIPPVLDNYAVDATLTVPLSDYVLRLAKSLDAARHGQDAARWEIVAVESRVRLEAKIAFYEWLRAGAAVEAAGQGVVDQRAHVTDVTAQSREGNASRADALRVESALADAEAGLAEAEAQRATAEVRLRTLLHLPDAEGFTTAEALGAPLASVAGEPSVWIGEAHRTRAELRGLDAAERSTRKQASIARATYLPTLAAFASATYANPNPRYFPPAATWHGTWAAGVAVTWAPTEIPGARASAAEAEAQGDALGARQRQLRDLLAVEVVQSFQSVRAADAKVLATDKQLEAATEAHRITRSLLANTRATASNLLDAETDLARARLARINARVEARVWRARLDHAAGRDQRAATP